MFGRRASASRGSAPTGGEKVLARARTSQGMELLGTRDALYLLTSDEVSTRHAWEQLHEAAWDSESETLTLQREEGVSRHHLPDADRGTRLFLQLVDERVRASILLQRHVPIAGARGVTVVARRAPHGRTPIDWTVRADAGLDPADPAVHHAMQQARQAAAQDLGLPD